MREGSREFCACDITARACAPTRTCVRCRGLHFSAFLLIKCVFPGVEQTTRDVENQIKGMWLASLELNNAYKCVCIHSC